MSTSPLPPKAGRRTLLVVEDDPDTANLVVVYFSGYDYHVEVASRGREGVERARRLLPQVVLLDINLPDIDGVTVCQQLAQSPRTSHIPIVFLSERATVSDRVAGLAAGAQDYLTKPFDLEELRLRVQNLIARSMRDNLVDPRTSLPTGRMVEEQLRSARSRPGWHIIECRIQAYQPFIDLNGFAAGDDVLKFAAGLVREIVDQHGTPEDYIGHPGHNVFLICTGAADPAGLAQRLTDRFNEAVQAHYSFMDREQGYVLIRDQDGQMAQAPLMTLQVTTQAVAG